MRSVVPRFVAIVTLAAAGLPHIGASPADVALQAVFTRMDGASKTFKGLTADVRKVTHTDIVNENEIEVGTLKVRLPKPHDFHMLIDFTKPNAKTVELSGTRAEVFYPNSMVIQRVELGKKNKNLVEQFLRLGF